jgi:hypothetical protein
MKQPSEFKDFQPYRVKMTAHDTGEIVYGIVDRFHKRAESLFKTGRCIVEDAVLPTSYTVFISDLIEIPFGDDRNPDEFTKFVEEAEAKAKMTSDDLGDVVAPGKLFTIGVGDGHAPYVITAVTPRTCKIEWRGFSPDRYSDQIFGFGGTFPKSIVAPFIHRQCAMKRIFAAASAK